MSSLNTFSPGAIWPDNNGVHINAHGGGVLLHNSVYYWFGEHKIEGEAGNLAHVGVHVYSSTDLYNWKDEGIALSVVKNDPTHDITEGCIIERPKVIYNEKTNKFVMWFHLELKSTGGYGSTSCSGVAVSDSPTGPYQYLRGVQPNVGKWPMNVQDCHKEPVRAEVLETEFCGGGLPAHPDELNLLGKGFRTGQMARDMTLFVDDDGKAYHIYSSESNSTAHIAELTDDYLDHKGKFARVFVARWMEAPALFKRQGKYYWIASGCTGWAPNTARYSVANSIWGPWMEVGNPCVGEGSDLTFGAQSTYVLQVEGKQDAFIFMADIWKPENAIDGRYVWLPIAFEEINTAPGIKIAWHDKWDLSVFDKMG